MFDIFLKKYNIDIILISKTHFNSKSGFKILIYTVDHTKHLDGHAILIRSNIKHNPTEILAKDYIQEINIVIEGYCQKLIIFYVQTSPRHKISRSL